ncbi:MAG: hypothetical protein ACLFR7_06975 [Opitutales bacterium]
MEPIDPSSASRRSPGRLRAAAHEGLVAARGNLVPAAILFTFALSLILAYQFWPAFEAALERVVEARERTGLLFPIVSTAFFGGALPLVFRRFLLRERAPLPEVLFAVGFWAFKGAEVALFYEFQAWFWGEGTDFKTLLAKVVTDQAIFCPLLAVPDMTLAYLWFHSGFSLSRMRAALRRKGFLERMLPVLISNASVWVPALFIVYQFPTALQLPLFNIILTFWVLTLAIVAKNQNETPDDKALEETRGTAG